MEVALPEELAAEFQKELVIQNMLVETAVVILEMEVAEAVLLV